MDIDSSSATAGLYWCWRAQLPNLTV